MEKDDKEIKVKRRKKTVLDPKQSVVAFINEVNASSGDRRAIIVNNLYNMHNANIIQKFTEFNGLKLISDWIMEMQANPNKLVLEALLNLAQSLPVKRPDIIATSIEKILYDLTSNPKFSACKDSIEKAIQIFDRATDMESGNSVYGDISRKKKIVGGIRWLPDSQLVSENDGFDDDSGGIDENTSSNATAELQKRKSKCGTTILWHAPRPINSKYEKLKEDFASSKKESERIKNATEANYYHQSLIPPNPLGPPLYTTLNKSSPIFIDFGPIDIAPNTEPKSKATPATTAQKPEPSAPPSDIGDLFKNPDLIKALSSSIPPTNFLSPSQIAQSEPYNRPIQVMEEKSSYGYAEPVGMHMYQGMPQPQHMFDQRSGMQMDQQWRDYPPQDFRQAPQRSYPRRQPQPQAPLLGHPKNFPRPMEPISRAPADRYPPPPVPYARGMQPSAAAGMRYPPQMSYPPPPQQQQPQMPVSQVPSRGMPPLPVRGMPPPPMRYPQYGGAQQPAQYPQRQQYPAGIPRGPPPPRQLYPPRRYP